MCIGSALDRQSDTSQSISNLDSAETINRANLTRFENPAVFLFGTIELSDLENFTCLLLSWQHDFISVLQAAAKEPHMRHASQSSIMPVSYTHLRAHETDSYLVCR